jgi:outer membrane protein insertion porin family
MGTLNLSIPNFRGEGEKLDLGLQIGQLRQNVSLNFTEPWAFNSPTTLQGGISYDKTRWASGDWTQEYGFNGGLWRQLRWPDDYFSAGLSYDLMWKDDFVKDETHFSNGIHLQPHGLQSKLKFTLRRDDTDMPTFPTQGSIISASPEVAGLGGDYQYLKTILSYDTYFPVFWKFVLGAHSKYGLINAVPWSPGDIRISRWDVLSAGGVWYTDGMIRGYDDLKFGGRNFPEFGKAMLALSTELRFPVLEQTLYLSVFGDAGNTWSAIENMNPADLYPGVGVGIRLLVPMLGLMGFDEGYGFKNPDVSDPFSTKASGFKFHFQMGKGF